MNAKISNQQHLNSRARAIGGRIELFNGWTFNAKDGTVYMVKTMAELTALIKNLESEANNER